MTGFISRLGGIEFTGARFQWEPGIYVKTVTGIDGGGKSSFERMPRGFGIGVHDTPNKRDAERSIVQAGFIFEHTEYELDKRIDQLGRLLAEDDETGRYVWVRRGRTRWAEVRRDGFPEPQRRPGGAPFADYVLPLRAPDQRIYGPVTMTPWGAAVSVTHRGGYPAPVSIEVRGNSEVGYTILGPRGRAAVVQRPVTPGSVHSYDGDTGLLEINGVPQVTGVTRSDRLEIPYGEYQFSVDHGCEMRVTFAPTWAP